MSVSQGTENKKEISKAKLHVGKPKWLKTPIPTGKTFFDIKKDLRERKLATVCEEAKCPNIGECWNTRTATFMVLGDTCTRACRFCNVKTGNPEGFLDKEEPMQVAQSSKLMKLKYVVITMVDRDDLEDGGAEHVAEVMRKVKEQNPGIIIELLAGDFAGSRDAVDLIANTGVEVYAHNIETVERLSPRVRDRRADYRQSLEVLKEVKNMAKHKILTKSALMLGLGEERDEVIQSLKDLREADVDLVTIGQYMKPSKRHLSIKRWVTPEEFAEYATIAKELGFKGVASKPLVRSSYMAADFYEKATGVSLS
jgi:lipoic acid synthetase